jgi:type 1 glutamine amidotransferase
MHTASICFDTWYGFQQLLGGTWSWGRTHHPELGPVEVRSVAEHPVTDGLSRFELADEVYHCLEIQPDVDLLLEARVPGGEWQAVAWCHEWAEGRVVYDALGHGPESLASSPHRRLLRQSMQWLMGEL